MERIRADARSEAAVGIDLAEPRSRLVSSSGLAHLDRVFSGLRLRVNPAELEDCVGDGNLIRPRHWLRRRRDGAALVGDHDVGALLHGRCRDTGGAAGDRSGPYRYVRHPAYTGQLLALFGFGLSLGNWAGLLAMILLPAGGFAYRIAVETALRSDLGQPYEKYMSRTWRLIPYLL